jgi:hypothetical protein
MTAVRLTEPSSHTLTRTDQLVVRPRVRRFGRRRFAAAALAVPLVAAGIAATVREVAHIERVLEEEAAHTKRATAYEIDAGGHLVLPLEAGTESLFVVVHAMNRGALGEVPHEARIHARLRGEHGEREEDVALDLPGVTSRVTPENASITVGDPAGFHIDASGLGVGTMDLTLTSIADADAVLVRSYRRATLEPAAVRRRGFELDSERREHLALHAWELDWAELEEDERSELLATHWTKLAPAHVGATPPRAHALTLAAPTHAPTTHSEVRDRYVTAATLDRDGRLPLVVRGPVRLRAGAQAPLLAHLLREDGATSDVQSSEELQVAVPEGTYAVQLSTPDPTQITVHASDPARVRAPERVTAFRVARAHPAVVENGRLPTVLRIAARRPVPKESSAEVVVGVDVRVANSAKVVEDRLARDVDTRYAEDDARGPTEPLVFYAALPPHAVLSIAPREEELDLTIAELDPNAAPLTDASETSEPTGGLAFRVPAEAGARTFVPRLPSNASSFGADARPAIETAPFTFARRRGTNPMAHAGRPRGPVVVREGKTFVSVREIDVTTDGKALVLPLRLASAVAADVMVRVDDGAPLRRPTTFRELTLSHSIRVEDETRFSILLGDDLPPGVHHVTFEVARGSPLWVHAPWTGGHRQAGVPHWQQGEVDE